MVSPPLPAVMLTCSPGCPEGGVKVRRRWVPQAITNAPADRVVILSSMSSLSVAGPGSVSYASIGVVGSTLVSENAIAETGAPFDEKSIVIAPVVGDVA